MNFILHLLIFLGELSLSSFMGASPKDAMAHQKSVPIVYSEENSSGAKKNVSFFPFGKIYRKQFTICFVFHFTLGYGSYDGMYKRRCFVQKLAH